MRFIATRTFIVALYLAAGLAGTPALARPLPQGSAPPTVRVGGDVKPPPKMKDVKPVYPEIAISHRAQGVVIIDATIGTDGKVKDTKVIRPMLYLTDAAVAAVREWEFKPTVVDGHPVQVIMTIPVNFTLQ